MEPITKVARSLSFVTYGFVRQGTHVEKLGFYVANLGRDHIILGYPWFKIFNPSFNWTTNTLIGEDHSLKLQATIPDTQPHYNQFN